MCLETKAFQDPTSPGVWWRDDASWKQYDVSQAAAIQRGIADGASQVYLGIVVSSKYTGGARYVVNLCTMKQVNLLSLYTRDVKIVKAPATSPGTAPTKENDNKSTKEEVRACQKVQHAHDKPRGLWFNNCVQRISSLENIVLKLETELVAMQVQLLENEAKRFAANAATANQVADLKTSGAPGCASRNAPRVRGD